MAQQFTGNAKPSLKPSLDAVTPPIGTVTQRPSDISSKNVAPDSKGRPEDLFADTYTAEVAAEVYALIVEAWKLGDSDAERLLDVDSKTWMRIKSGKWNGLLDREQLMRISAIIGLHEALHSCFNEELANRWVKRPNTGPMFSGRKPLDVMIEDGLPTMIKARDYMGALLGIE